MLDLQISNTSQLRSLTRMFFLGLEFGELHLCPDSSTPSRERGRSGCHKRKNIFWSCGQYSESKLFTSVNLNFNSVWCGQFSTEKEIILAVMYFNYWCHCVCVPILGIHDVLKLCYLKKGYIRRGTYSASA